MASRSAFFFFLRSSSLAVAALPSAELLAMAWMSTYANLAPSGKGRGACAAGCGSAAGSPGSAPPASAQTAQRRPAWAPPAWPRPAHTREPRSHRPRSQYTSSADLSRVSSNSSSFVGVSLRCQLPAASFQLSSASFPLAPPLPSQFEKLSGEREAGSGKLFRRSSRPRTGTSTLLGPQVVVEHAAALRDSSRRSAGTARSAPA